MGNLSGYNIGGTGSVADLFVQSQIKNDEDQKKRRRRRATHYKYKCAHKLPRVYAGCTSAGEKKEALDKEEEECGAR